MEGNSPVERGALISLGMAKEENNNNYILGDLFFVWFKI